MLVKTGENDEAVNCSNPISIMMEMAKVAYLDEILFGKKDSKDRIEIVSFIELAQRTEAEELVAHIQKHLAMKMFLVGQSITAADIIICLYIADYFKELLDFQKIEQAHVFRWLDHIQHLPGMAEQVESLGLFVPFPDVNAGEPSKAQLKKLAKIQEAKDKKAAKKAGGNAQPEEKKGGEQKGDQKAGEEKPKK